MTKYRLKKDTPEFKAGTVFDMVENIDVGKVLTMNAPREDAYAFEVDSIDNFDEWFEPVSGKWPQKDAPFWSISADGSSFQDTWLNHPIDRARMAIGNAFKTKEAADRFANYLKAITTVSKDEGFMLQTTRGGGVVDSEVATVVQEAGSLQVRKIDYAYRRAGAFYFDTVGHAYSSITKHRSDWQTIYDYKWGKE